MTVGAGGNVGGTQGRGPADGSGARGTGGAEDSPSGRASRRGLHGFEIFWVAFGLVYGVRLIMALVDRRWREVALQGLLAVGSLVVAWVLRRRRRAPLHQD